MAADFSPNMIDQVVRDVSRQAFLVHAANVPIEDRRGQTPEQEAELWLRNDAYAETFWDLRPEGSDRPDQDRAELWLQNALFDMVGRPSVVPMANALHALAFTRDVERQRAIAGLMVMKTLKLLPNLTWIQLAHAVRTPSPEPLLLGQLTMFMLAEYSHSSTSD